MGIPAGLATAAASMPGVIALFENVMNLFSKGHKILSNTADSGVVSLPAYTKPLRLLSRVYIDESVANNPVITDVIKSVHTQYAAFVLTALQMNQFVKEGISVQDMLRVVATEDNQTHESVVEGLFGSKTSALEAGKVPPFIKPPKPDEERPNPVPPFIKPPKSEPPKASPVPPFIKPVVKPPEPKGNTQVTGKIVSLSGDPHIPSGKLLEITLVNPENPNASVTLNLMIQLAPYIVPQQISVEFLVKDAIPTMYQRFLMWKTGEISFWRDFVAMGDVVDRRNRLRRMDPTGVIDSVLNKQAKSRQRVFGNINRDKAEKARNIANSVLIFNRETVQRAKADFGFDLSNSSAREKYFATSFAMIIVVVDPLYNQVTFYYNGLDDTATFSFDQMAPPSKGGGLDLVSVMNALNQGRAPRF